MGVCMKLKPQLILIIIIVLAMIGSYRYFSKANDVVETNASVPENTVDSAPVTTAKPIKSHWIDEEVAAIHAVASQLDTKVLRVSLTAYQNAKEKGLVQDQVITIVDYSKPSNQRRLWVVNLKTNKVLFNTYVAHGKNSGASATTSFSNSPSSLKSSMGVFLTDETYSGHNGYSLRVKGLEQNVNSNAYNRTIVFHGAAYVSPAIAKARGMLGRSWGCFAVSRDMIAPIINTIKHKTLVIAYYPDKHWLSTSKFLR